ncbi:MAG: carboxylate-amine ligase [Flavisolibacter sp.]|nr:carboxylate-amine ligase [Flavisolibacter sp.]
MEVIAINDTLLNHQISNNGGDKETKEKKRFKKLQENFIAQFESAFPDKMAPKTVIIIPSLTLDQEILEKIHGINYYEERMLCLLMLLRMPQTHVIYITSMPIDPAIVDYYLHLLPGITSYHARQRLTLLSCFDASPCSLTQKILDRPRLINRIRNSIPHTHVAHLSCFNVTEAERKLAVELQVPIYGCDPDLTFLGNKSCSRKIFKACGIDVPPGFEDLHSEDDIAEALLKLKAEMPHLDKAVVKINEGFSGEGNAIFTFPEMTYQQRSRQFIKEQLRNHLHIIAENLTYPVFLQKFRKEGGIVEAFIEGTKKYSPSVQCRINPLGKIDVISTHDQLLGGKENQVFLGARFPAHPEYAPAIGEAGRRIAEELKYYGVLGRFSVDFISVKEQDEWKNYAIEINLRKGGTTHPYLMLQFLTNGEYDAEKAIYYTANNQPRYYLCSDNFENENYKGLTPHDLIDIAMCNDLLYDGSSQEGVIFHLISAASQYGKIGIVCIGDTPERADYFYNKTVEVLYREGQIK